MHFQPGASTAAAQSRADARPVESPLVVRAGYKQLFDLKFTSSRSTSGSTSSTSLQQWRRSNSSSLHLAQVCGGWIIPSYSDCTLTGVIKVSVQSLGNPMRKAMSVWWLVQADR